MSNIVPPSPNQQVRLELVGVDGEGLTLQVPDCLVGRELHVLVSKQLPPKPGAVRLLQQKESILEFNKTLREQGILPNSCFSYVYIPAKVYSVWKVLAGMRIDGKEQEFARDTVQQLVGISNSSGLRDLSSLQDVIFSSDFDESQLFLSSLTFGRPFNQTLDYAAFPSSNQNIPGSCKSSPQLAQLDLQNEVAGPPASANARHDAPGPL